MTFYMCGLFSAMGILVALINAVRLAPSERRRKAWKSRLVPPALLATGWLWAVLWAHFTAWSSHSGFSPEVQTLLNQAMQVLALAAAPCLAILALSVTQNRRYRVAQQGAPSSSR